MCADKTSGRSVHSQYDYVSSICDSRSLFNFSACPIGIRNEHGDFIYCNKSFVQRFSSKKETAFINHLSLLDKISTDEKVSLIQLEMDCFNDYGINAVCSDIMISTVLWFVRIERVTVLEGMTVFLWQFCERYTLPFHSVKSNFQGINAVESIITPRELSVFCVKMLGFSNDLVANKLNITKETVASHWSSASKKFFSTKGDKDRYIEMLIVNNRLDSIVRVALAVLNS